MVEIIKISPYILKMNYLKLYLSSLITLSAISTFSQKSDSIFQYRVEAAVTASTGDFAPLWLTANRYGMESERPNSGYLRAGLEWILPEA